MNTKFDELTKQMAQSVTRRQALTKLGMGFVGIALACFGLGGARAQTTCLPSGYGCRHDSDCCSGDCHLYKIGGRLNVKACL